MTDVDEFEIGIKSEELMEALSPWISSDNEAATIVIEQFMFKYLNITTTLMELAVNGASKVSSVDEAVRILRREAADIRAMTESEVSGITKNSVAHAIEWSAKMIDTALGKTDDSDEEKS